MSITKNNNTSKSNKGTASKGAAGKKNYNIGESAMNVISAVANRVESIETKAKNDIREIPLNEIQYSPRNSFGMQDIEKLAESIRQNGQLHNAVVRPIANNDNPEIKYEMISGERRHKALSLLGAKTIYAKVVEVSDLEAERMLLVANIDARELTEIERSNSVTRLFSIVEEQRGAGVDFGGKRTKDIVSDMLSQDGKKVTASTVTQLKKLQDLIDEFKPLVESGEISRELAYQYAQMTTEQQKAVFAAFESGKALSANEAKVLKEEMQNKDTAHQSAIEEMKKQLDKKEKETNDYKAQADANALKVKTLDTDKKKAENALKGALDDKQKLEKEAEKKKETLKKELEKEIRKNVEEQNASKIKELQDKIDAITNKDKETMETLENRIKQLQDDVKAKAAEKASIEGNKSIQALARQVQRTFNMLMDEINTYKKTEGFAIDEETKAALAEIQKYENKLK